MGIWGIVDNVSGTSSRKIFPTTDRPRAPGPRQAGKSESAACREAKTRLATKIGVRVHFLPVIASQLLDQLPASCQSLSEGWWAIILFSS